MSRIWGFTLVAVVLAGSAGCTRVSTPSNRLLTSVSQIRKLSQNQVYAGAEAHLRGVLTYAFASEDVCYIQDPTGGIRIQLRRGLMVAEPGQSMEVWGTVVSGGAAPALAESHFKLLGDAPLPAPEVLGPGIEAARRQLYRRVRVTGVVQTAIGAHNDFNILTIQTPHILVSVKAVSPAFSDADPLIDADVGIEGVVVAAPGIGDADGFAVWAPALAKTVILKAAPSPNAAPPTTIAHLRRLLPPQLPAHRVLLRGRVATDGSGKFFIEDAGGRMPLLPGPGGFPHTGPHEIAGFAVFRDGDMVLENAVDTKLVHKPSGLPLQLTAGAVHHLTGPEASRLYPVRLRGVVTYSDPFNGILFIEDRTDGMFVSLEDPTSGVLRPGDAVEVTGETTPGSFAPSVTRAHFRRLGRAPLPHPAAGSIETAFQGQRDCRWVELSGVIQSVVPGSREAMAQVVFGMHRFQARILAPVEDLAPFVNADVKLRGVCGALFNDRRQMLGIVLYVPGLDYIHVERASPADVFALPLQSIESLLQFSSGAAVGHRIRLRGVVTATEPSGPAWIQDATGAIAVHDFAVDQIAPGDLADVVGFPAPGPYSPILNGAIVRRIKSGKPPAPAVFNGTQLLEGSHDGQLVQVDGVLVDRTFRADQPVLVLKSGHVQFTAEIAARGVLPLPEPGALLRVTGVYATLVDDSRETLSPRSFEIRMRSAAGLVVLQQPPWLTFERLLPIFLITLLIAGVALIWASRLRRRLQAQTTNLVQKTVQLEKEHTQTTRALRRAQEAEVMEQAHKHVLELVARDEDLDGVLLRLAQAVEEHCPGVSCSIQLRLPGGQRFGASPSLSREWQHALAGIEIEDYCGEGVHTLAALSPVLREIAERQAACLNRVCLTPIARESRVIGVVLAFLAGEIVLRQAQRDFLLSASKLAALALERRVLYDRLSHQAQHDELTGLENRAALLARLSREIGVAAATGSLLGVIYIDLDNFKQINDTFGHAAGDAVLKEAAQRMLGGIRRSDALARLGGDEFVIVLPNLGQRADAQRVSAQLVASLARPIPFSGHSLVIGASVGTSLYPVDGTDPDTLLKAADHRMYSEKSFRHFSGLPDPSAGLANEPQMIS